MWGKLHLQPSACKWHIRQPVHFLRTTTQTLTMKVDQKMSAVCLFPLYL